MSVKCKDCGSTLTAEEVEYLEHTCSQCELEAHMAFQESEMAEAQTMIELKPCPFCGSQPVKERIERFGFKNGDYVCCGNDNCAMQGVSLLEEHWNTRTITRADIPEEIVREIQADTLGEAALHFAEYNVAGGTLSSPQWLLKRSSELREQKDGTV